MWDLFLRWVGARCWNDALVYSTRPRRVQSNDRHQNQVDFVVMIDGMDVDSIEDDVESDSVDTSSHSSELH